MPTSTSTTAAAVQTKFESALPTVERTLAYSLRRLRPSKREDKTADALGLAWMYFVRLDRQGKNPLGFITTLANFAARHAMVGRSVVSSGGCTRSDACGLPQERQSPREFSLHAESLLEMVEDRRPSPADMAVLRIDFSDWLSRLSGRQRNMALELASGTSTQEAAKRFNVTPGRISQYRAQLRRDWESFQGNGSPS